ncbi:MFS transporter [Gottfriedia sp. NPDC057991]|uniref:MFS transporter n=1 Tax=Gottfriedia sp. NPDC057991 TaxID=3346298 RepID=UPI0036DB880F
MESVNNSLEKQTIKKVTRRIIPFVFILYIIAFLDRANIGYAALQMNKDLGLTPEIFGLVSGIFFIGYFIFEVPSNILLHRVGARKWIARILVTWGIVGALTGFAQNIGHLYILRFLLGVAEAGFFPGIILYLTYWFRGKELARTIALFMTAITVSYVIGAPLSAWILDHIHWLNMDGWRWVFIFEGLPAVVLGFVTYFYLTDRPEDAKWLTQEEKTWLINELQKEQVDKKAKSQHSMKKVMKNPKVWYFSLIYFLYITGGYGIGYFMPQIIQGLSNKLSNFQVGLITMIPYIAAAIAMNIWSRRSDRTGESFLHAAFPLILAFLGLIGLGYFSNPFVAIGMIVIATASMYSFSGPFWSLPPQYLKGSAAAVGLALVNSFGNLGGFLGPYMMGSLKELTGSATIGLYVLSGCMLCASLLLLVMRKRIATNKRAQNEIHNEYIL